MNKWTSAWIKKEKKLKIEKTDGKSEEEKNDLLERREIVITCQGTKGGN